MCLLIRQCLTGNTYNSDKTCSLKGPATLQSTFHCDLARMDRYIKYSIQWSLEYLRLNNLSFCVFHRFEKYIHICIFYPFLTPRCHGFLKSVSVKEISWWYWPGDTGSQVNSTKNRQTYIHAHMCILSRHLRGSDVISFPDSKVHGANMGPIWGRQGPGGSHVGPMNFAIWVVYISYQSIMLPVLLAVYCHPCRQQ